MLSDDEVNYSILEAEKSILKKIQKDNVELTPSEKINEDTKEDLFTSPEQQYLKTKLSIAEKCDISNFPLNLSYNNDSIILLDEELNNSLDKSSERMQFETMLNEMHLSTKVKKVNESQEFSFMNLIDERITNTSTAVNPNLDFESALEQIKADYPLSQIEDQYLSFKENSFDLPDDQSQSIFKTPTKNLRRSTPNKEHNFCKTTSEFSFLEESPLHSPSTKLAPVKRFRSANTQKFNKLLRSVEKEEAEKCSITENRTDDFDSLSDFDEIDKLIYGSPRKSCYKMPSGLDKLLTGEINISKEVQNQNINKLTSSLSLPVSSSQLSPEISKEFQYNGKTYIVRKTGFEEEKPDYQNMDESLLLKHLYNFGIKPLKRKLAVKMLGYIYDQTHPYLIEDEVTKSDICLKNDKKKPEPEKGTTSKDILKDCWGDVLVKTNEELFGEIDEEQYIFQTNITKKVNGKLLMHIKVSW